MTSRTRIILTVAAALLLLAGFLAAINKVWGPQESASSDLEVHGDIIAPDVPLQSWPAPDEPSQTRVEIDPIVGPILDAGDAGALPLTPTHPAMRFTDWRMVRGESLVQVIGRGKWQDAKLVATWSFFPHNPQAYLTIKIADLPAQQLRQSIILTMKFPTGRVVPKPAANGVGAQVATWFDKLDSPVVSVSNWSGTSLHASGQESGQDSDQNSGQHATHKLRLGVWTRSDHLAFERCPKDKAVDLEISLMLSVDIDTSVSIWPYARGAEAALAPVFSLPAEHADPQIADIAAPDARRWVRRANGLIYGHSDPDDPRSGNGGLLGYGLGATVIIPPKFSTDPDIKSLAKKLAATRVELAPGLSETSIPEAYQASSRAFKNLDCDNLAALTKHDTPAAIVTQSAPDDAAKRPLHPGPSDWPLLVLPESLDGRLETLRLRGFEPSAVEPLLKTHQTRVFSTPFVATRNPLIGAAHESLLKPTRDGHWTVSAPLSGALSNLELWREESPLMVSSVGELARYRASIKRTSIWWDASKKLQVYNPTDSTISGFTVALRGDVDAKDADRILNRRVLLAPNGESIDNVVTLIWWDVEPGLHRISIEDHGAENDSTTKLSAPSATTWSISASD